MNNKTQKVLKTPIIGMVVALNQNLIQWVKPAYKIIQRNYLDTMLRNGHLLFLYARRQLLGKDYYKRVVDIIEEMQSDAYFIAELGGWSRRIAGTIDAALEEILAHLSAQNQSRKVQ